VVERRLAGPTTVAGAEGSAKQRLQTREVAGYDAYVGLDDGPDGEVARVPEPVAGLAVAGEERDFD
jgi:hypothetical protein